MEEIYQARKRLLWVRSQQDSGMGEKQARRCQSCSERHCKPRKKSSHRQKERYVRAWVNDVQSPQMDESNHRSRRHRHFDDSYEVSEDSYDEREEQLREPSASRRRHCENHHKHKHHREHRRKPSQQPQPQDQQQPQQQQQSAEELEQQRRTREQLEMLKRTSLREFGELGRQMRRAMSLRRSGKWDVPMKLGSVPTPIGRRKGRVK
ncbi:hypothetical protein SprV_0602193300 [Sparganum proliferum]